MLNIRLICGFITGVCCLAAFAQNKPQQAKDANEITLRVTSDAVLLDVVVTGNAGHPVLGLNKNRFQVFEDGRPQTITSFEPHADSIPGIALKSIKVPPGSYSNTTSTAENGPANVVLVDLLNTPLADQANVYQELVKFLQNARSGRPIALLSSSYGLHLVQSFTTDPAKLLADLQSHKLKLENPALLRTPVQLDSEASIENMMTQTGAGDAAAALTAFQEKQAEFELRFRVETTLNNLERVALYLSGFPGRKNLIWLSGAFPVLVPSSAAGDDITDYSEEVRKTTNLLAASQIALYPIDSRGLMLAPTTDAALTGRQRNPPGKDLYQFETQTNFEHDSMKTMARQTGGAAFFNSNAISESIAAAVNDGAAYYAISYRPANRSEVGKLRKIEVKLDGVKANLAYRRGYFERDSRRPKSRYEVSSFDGAMQRGLPQADQLVFTMDASPSDAQPTPSNADEKKSKIVPVLYQLDFATDLRNFTLSQGPEGLREGKFMVAAIAYSPEGAVLNGYSRQLSVSFNQRQYEHFLSTGMQIHESIALPVGNVFLRAGIYDIASGKIGTLEVPLTVTVPVPVKANPVETAAEPAPPTNPPPPAPAEKHEEAAHVPTDPTPDSGLKGLQDDDSVAAYCDTLAVQSKEPTALATACRFVVSLRRKMPNLICNREMKRYNRQVRDVVTASVTYKEGLEYPNDVRINGQPSNDSKAPEKSGAWSMGEFATALEAIFAPVSHAKFKFEKETTLHKIPALIFEFQVAAKENKLYSLHAIYPTGKQSSLFPAYHGELWIDKADFGLLRLERKTGGIDAGFPISSATTEIDYTNLPLGDGTNFVLPTHADVQTCSVDEGLECAHNIVSFTNWHKYGAKSRILAAGDEQK